MTAPLRQEQLNAMGCGNPICIHGDHTILYFHSECHPGRQTVDVYWSAAAWVVTFRCAKCADLIARVALADGEPSPENRCHPRARVEAAYDKATGAIWLTCAQCRGMPRAYVVAS